MNREVSVSPIDLVAEKRSGLSQSHRKIADFILGQPFRAAMMGIEELAASASVSAATVNRFVRGLGFDGYAQFRGASVRPFHGTMAPVEKLRGQKVRPTEADQIMRESLRRSAANLALSEQFLIRESCEAAASAILKARRVVIVALGIAAPLARLAGDLLEPYCDTVEVLDGRGGPERMIRRTMRLGQGDLLIALTLPRYSRMTIDLLRSGRDQGARTLGITDGPDSPIAPLCDIVLFGAAEHDVLHGSCVGLLALTESLAAVLAQRQQTVADATELTKRILPHLFADDTDLAS
ncbi:MAG: MurR/RpiR family transcriptional regulator [Proteobacteria bacterium]|nr:MurR/RpiR family transcriptional regulator [Pseudomonadota bacterium]